MTDIHSVCRAIAPTKAIGDDRRLLLQTAAHQSGSAASQCIALMAPWVRKRHFNFRYPRQRPSSSA